MKYACRSALKLWHCIWKEWIELELISKTIKVLLVEDEPGDAGLIKRMLAYSTVTNFEVTWVETLAAARGELSRGSTDLVLLDLSLPDAQGLETLKGVISEGNKLPVVVLTGNDDHKFALDVLGQGAQDYLVKGNFNEEVLYRSLRYALIRTQTEKALRDSEEKFRQMADNMGEVFWLRSADNQRVLYVNPAFEKIWGRSSEELYNDPGAFTKSIHPDDMHQVETEFIEYTQGKPFNLEYRIIRPDGEERCIWARSFPIKDAEGQITGHTGIAADITERKDAERELKINEERFRRVFDEGPLGMALMDLEARFFMINDETCNILGYTREELMHVNIIELIHPDDHAVYDQQIKEFLQGKESKIQKEFCLVRKDGGHIWVSVTLTVIMADNDLPLYYLAMLEDITERIEVMNKLSEHTAEMELINLQLENARDEANEASKAKSDFLSVMSHEIRTPMNSIIGMAELLADTPLNEEQKGYIDIFKESGETLLGLINDILDLAKIESGRLELNNEQFELKDMIEKTIRLLRMRAKEKEIELNCTINSEVPDRVIGDADRLRQVLINLIGNAIKFTDSGEVELIVEPCATQDGIECDDDAGIKKLLFSVKDTGMGIPIDRQEAIFDEFTQADSSSTRKHGGTGLGLSISKRIVEKMQGEIWAESMLGLGSTFSFTMVFEKAPELMELEANSASTTSSGSQSVDREKAKPGGADSTTATTGLDILMAEDNADNRLLVQAFLKKTSHRLTIVENGAEAVQAIKANKYDLVLMDIQMPVMDGYTATKEIRTWEQAEGRDATPVIALTAHALNEDIQKSLDAGCDEHLTKPIKKSLLLETISKYEN